MITEVVLSLYSMDQELSNTLLSNKEQRLSIFPTKLFTYSNLQWMLLIGQKGF